LLLLIEGGSIMPVACPVGLDSQRLRGEISSIYGRVAVDPTGDFHFHRGPLYAVEFLNYDPVELEALPAECTASFAGVGNPHRAAVIGPGETVLDIGSGAGMDLLLAARHVGVSGRAIGVDMTEGMVERARESAASARLSQVEVCKGDATRLPIEDATVDVVISNGVLNLVPEKEKAFAEIWRVLRPGGRLQLADVVVDVELTEDARSNIDLWAG
jgi:SAM-dependent methyltransferase